VTTRTSATIEVEPDRVTSNWRLLLVGVESVRSVDGGTATSHEHGTLIHAEGRKVVVHLD